MAERTDDERAHDAADMVIADQDPTVKPDLQLTHGSEGYRVKRTKAQLNAMFRMLDILEPIMDHATDGTQGPAEEASSQIMILLRAYGVLPGFTPDENDENSP